jgi:rfaE bifunctional protein kinase chain/domain
MAEYAPYILQHVGDLSGREVLIVGDVGLDEYTFGQVRRISPEAPVPVVEVESEETRLGLAANVAQNVAQLGGTARLIGIVGRDQTAEQFRALLTENGVSPEHLIADPSRPTTRKLRVMAKNHHIVRVDYEHRKFLSPEMENAILKQVQVHLPKSAAIVIQDYAKGVVSERLVAEIVRMARAAGKKIMVDPHRNTPIKTYRGVDLLKANYDESIALSGIVADDLRKDAMLLDRVGNKLMQELGLSQVVITLGKDGMRIFDGGQVTDLPTNAKQVFDVTGAGDTAIAAIALAWGSGFNLDQACALANFASGVVVGKIGCVPCSTAELIEAVREC